MPIRPFSFLLLLEVLLATGCAVGRPHAAAAGQGAHSAATTVWLSDDDTTSGAPVVLVLGNSLAAGYGLPPSEEAFPAFLQQKIDALGWKGRVVNASMSGMTTAGGLNRLGELLRRHAVDVLILELGGNDGLRGLSPAVIRRNLQQIIDRTRAKYPDVRILLAGLRIPPSAGQPYAARFRAIYPALAEKNDVAFVPLLLKGVAGIPRLTQPDGIHPTAEGQRIIAENVWEVLKPVLQDLRQKASAPH